MTPDLQSLAAEATADEAGAAASPPAPTITPNQPSPLPSAPSYTSGTPAPHASVVQGDDLSALAQQAQAAEDAETQQAQAGVGALDVKKEQDGYQQQIDASRPPITNTVTPVPTTADNLEATAADVGHRIVDIGRGALAGIVNAGGELESSMAGLMLNAGPLASMSNTTQWNVLAKYTSNPATKAFAQQQLANAQAVTDVVTGAPRALAAAEAPSVDTIGGSLAEGVTQFAVAFAGLLKGEPEGLGIAARVGYRALAGGVAQAADFNPNDARLSNLIQEHPALKNPVTQFLASQPGDSEALGRLKNFLEGTVLSGAGEAVTESFTHILTGMRASGAIADTVKGIQEAKPTEIPSTAPVVPEAEPQATEAAEGAAAGSTEAAQPATVQASAPAPAWPPDVSAWKPSALKDVDTATPRAASEVPPVSETDKDTNPPAVQPETFNPDKAAQSFMSIPADKAQDVLQAINEGRYNDVPGMLDATHDTIPWDTLSDGANLKGTFAAVEQNLGDMIRDAHGVVSVPKASVLQLAKDIGGDVSSVPRLMQDTTSDGGLAARITAGYNIMTASARRLQSLADNVRMLNVKEPEGQKAVLAFEQQLQLHSAIVGQVRRSSSEIGRALWAHRELKASSDVALRNVSELANTTLGPGAIKKFAKELGTSNNLADINAAADKIRGKGLMGVIKEIAQNGMLSGPSTQIANIVGNVGNGIIKVAERYLAGVIGKARGVLMPGTETATIRSAVAHTTGAIAGIRDSFPLFVKALTSEQNVSASGRVLTRAIYKDPTGLTGAELTLAQVINRVGQVVRYPGRFMGAIDNLNMGVGYQGDLQARTYLMAAREADTQGIAGDARDAFMDKRMADLRSNPPADVREKSLDAGLYQSFQEAAKTRFGEGISSMLNSHPLVKLIIAPFVHRPLNMLRQSLMDYTALGLTSRTMRETLGAANADSDVAIARMVIGTGALTYGYHLAHAGYLTGERLGSNNTENLDNIPRDAVKLGSNWHEFNRLDPLGTWLAVSADLYEAINRAYDPNNADHVAQLGKAARSAVQVVGAAAMDKSFMQSVSQIMDVIGSKDPKRADVLMQRLVDSNVFKFVPFSGALRAAARANDTTERVSGGDGLSNIWDSVKGNLPVMSQELPPRRDILGRPVALPGGTSAWWNPFAGTTAASDHMDQELSKLAVNVREPPRTLQGITMTPEAYDEVITRSTKAPIFPDGQNLEGFLRTLVSSNEWKSYDTTDDHGVMAHTKMVQEAVDSAYDYGKQDYMQAHPDFIQKMQANAVAQAKHWMRQ